jgi:hypothetical protein
MRDLGVSFGGLPQADTKEQVVWNASGYEGIPEPVHQVLRRGTDTGEIIQIAVVHSSCFKRAGGRTTWNSVREGFDDGCIDDALEIIKVHDHAIIRCPWGLFDGTAQRHLQPIGMPVCKVRLSSRQVYGLKTGIPLRHFSVSHQLPDPV